MTPFPADAVYLNTGGIVGILIVVLIVIVSLKVLNII